MAGGLLLSCSDEDAEEVPIAPPPPVKSGHIDLGEVDYSEDEFSPWMSKADQQIAYEGLEEGYYFAHTEGRNNGGYHQYRHVHRKFPSDQYTEWGVFWGLTVDEFYKVDLKMQQEGFTRVSLQVFEDSAGKAYHQAVWLQPKE